MFKTIMTAAAACLIALGSAYAQGQTQAEMTKALKWVNLNTQVMDLFEKKIKDCQTGNPCPAKEQGAEYINFAIDCSIKYGVAKRLADKPIDSPEWKVVLKVFEDDRDSCIKQLRFREESLLIRFAETPQEQTTPISLGDTRLFFFF
jgi:hypothetical protein